MASKLFVADRGKCGFTLVEVMIALLISAVILTVVVSLYTTSAKTFQSVKDVSDVKEIGKSGMAQLEWLFQRWGTSTPCDNANTALCTSAAQDCRVNEIFAYPPPSSVCITILDRNPDEVFFYANLYGNGFVHIPPVDDSTILGVKSCRLSTEEGDNCYHIKMGAKFLVDQQNTSVYKPLVFSLSSLSSNNLVCTDGTIEANATVSARAKALNGSLDSSGSAKIYMLEGGEVLLRVPHLVRLFCKSNASDGGRMWLYMELTDMASDCHAHEKPQPLIPVNAFNVRTQGEGVVVTMQVRGTGGKCMDIERHFGR